MSDTATAPKTFAEATEILARALPGYETRPQQTAMAEAIEAVLAADEAAQEASDGEAERKALLVQAGCGTGKSFALAIPAALSGRRVVLSTATNALLHQIVGKDLPFLAEHIPGFPTFAKLMGINNYVCLAKLQENPAIEELAELTAAVAADPDMEGSRDTLPLQVSGESWGQVSTTSAECPGAKGCPLAAQCFPLKARAKAAEARIVVTNHTLTALDMKLRKDSDGMASILGKVSALFLDEADAADAYFRSALSTKLTQRGLMQLAAAAETFVKAAGKLSGKTLNESTALVSAVHGMNLVLPRVKAKDAKPGDVPGGASLPLTWFGENSDQVKALLVALDAIASRIGTIDPEGPREKTRQQQLKGQAQNAAVALTEAIRAEDGDMARFNTWTQNKTGDQFWTVEFVPVDLSDRLREGMWSVRPTILASATLTTAPGDFRYIQRIMGLEDPTGQDIRTLDVGTPFDYQTQAALFVPNANVPDPNERGAWLAYVATATYDLVQSAAAAGQGSLLLYTSRSAMEAAHAVLAPRFEALGLKVFIQDGKTSTAELRRLKAEFPTSILFGLKSFFVGIDLQGDLLGLVVIDKLPFPVPTEPVQAAREANEKRAGRNPFYSLSVPIMTLDLTQAFGRLIRTRKDTGLVAILDSRLSSKGYGSQIVNGLPNCNAVTDLADATRWFGDREGLLADIEADRAAELAGAF